MNTATDIKKRMLDTINPPTDEQEVEGRIISSLSEELAKLHQEVRLSNLRIERKLNNTLTGRTKDQFRPKTGVVSVISTGINEQLDETDAISFGEQGCFSPLGSFSVIQGRIVVQISAHKLRTYPASNPIGHIEPHETKQLEGRIFLGLNISEAEACNLFIDISQVNNHLQIPSIYSTITFWSKGKLLQTQFGNTLRHVQDQSMGAEAFKCYQLEKEAIDSYKHQFVKIKLPKESIDSIPSELATIPELHELQKEITHWIEVKLPYGLEQDQDNVQFYLNPVLVMNRELKQWSPSGNLQSTDDFVVKLENPKSKFLHIERVNGLKGKAYREITFSSFLNSPPGSYQLLRGGLEKNNVPELIQNLEDLLEVSYSIFHQLSLILTEGNRQNNDLVAIKNNLDGLRGNYQGFSQQTTSPAHYLKVRPREVEEQVTLWYWESDCVVRLPYSGQIGKIEDKELVVFWI